MEWSGIEWNGIEYSRSSKVGSNRVEKWVQNKNGIRKQINGDGIIGFILMCHFMSL